MNHILLLGAGFTRNWGGWLASEAFEYLLGCPELNDRLRDLLWEYKDRGGFEAALSSLQEKHHTGLPTIPDSQLDRMQRAIQGMFNAMNSEFGRSGFSFEFSNDRSYSVTEFLTRFDAGFTLNQDMLLDKCYLKGNVELSQQWTGWNQPGMRPVRLHDGMSDCHYIQDNGNYCVSTHIQPVFKIHGSTNWYDSEGEGLLVLGGNKSESISRYPILTWYFEQFRDYLSQDDSRLMIIGYGFGDDHVNDAIRSAAESNRLRLFIIDTLGVDVLDKNRDTTIPVSDILIKKLGPKVIGASRRNLSEIFKPDPIEHAKLMRFFG